MHTDRVEANDINITSTLPYKYWLEISIVVYFGVSSSKIETHFWLYVEDSELKRNEENKTTKSPSLTVCKGTFMTITGFRRAKLFLK